jgi:DNA-binding transcriptional MocR family regulator
VNKNLYDSTTSNSGLPKLNLAQLPKLKHQSAKLYERVANEVIRLIEQGILARGERIPSIRNLQKQLGVSLSTVVQAYSLLENQGFIEARPNSGYYVKVQPEKALLESKTSYPLSDTHWNTISDIVYCLQSAAQNPEIIPFGTNIPGVQLFPTVKLNQFLIDTSRRIGEQANTYEAFCGNEALRYQLAKRSLQWSSGISSEEIVTTAGCMEAINLCLRAVARPGDTIAIESPTYYGIILLLESLGMKALEIPTHPEDGVCLENLEDTLKNKSVKACLFILNFNNPQGTCMPDERKKYLVEMLSRHKIPLIENDVLGSLYFGKTRPCSAKVFDKEGFVLLCSSFSKTLVPGYRVGWCVPGRYLTQVTHLKSVTSVSTGTLVQATIAEFLQNGNYDKHLRLVRKTYSRQIEYVMEVIKNYFPSGTLVNKPRGGYVLWVELPQTVNSLDLLRQALTKHISIAPGPIFSPTGKFSNFMCLNCANPWSSNLEQGLITLADLVSQRMYDN